MRQQMRAEKDRHGQIRADAAAENATERRADRRVIAVEESVVESSSRADGQKICGQETATNMATDAEKMVGAMRADRIDRRVAPAQTSRSGGGWKEETDVQSQNAIGEEE
jgi:hypothetical protein